MLIGATNYNIKSHAKAQSSLAYIIQEIRDANYKNAVPVLRVYLILICYGIRQYI
jgi:hypothetical protein